MPESITNPPPSPKRIIRRPWLTWAVVILVCMLISFCLDRPILKLVRRANVAGMSGDVVRTFESFKEFGQVVAIIVACLLIFILDKPRRSMLPRLIICILLPSALVWPIKLTVHRLRPHAVDFEQGDTVLGLGFYFEEDPKLRTHVTSVSGKDKIQKDRYPFASEKQSFPSAHTATAFAFAVGLAALYPPARWIFYALAVGCGAHRIIFGAHWLSDVVASVFVGFLVARAVWNWRKT